jgi:hypothetical protein
MYVAYLHKEGLKSSSVRVYLAALRAYHIDNGYGNPLEAYLRVQKAVRAMEIDSIGPHQKLPITGEVMLQLHGQLKKDYNSMVLWAGMTLAYFGCLRAAELTVMESQCFDPNIHLTVQDININEASKYVSVHIKRSKTDKFNKGFHVHIACTQGHVCFFCALHDMLRGRTQLGLSMQPKSPLFLFTNGMALTRKQFTQQTRLHLAGLGIDSSKYSGHSFRAGSATTAAMAGMPDWQIKTLGRWKSNCYQTYIRIPVATLLQFSKTLSK